MRLSIPKSVAKTWAVFNDIPPRHFFTSTFLVAFVILFIIQHHRVERMKAMADFLTYEAPEYGACAVPLVLAAADGPFFFDPRDFARGVAASVCPRPAREKLR